MRLPLNSKSLLFATSVALATLSGCDDSSSTTGFGDISFTDEGNSEGETDEGEEESGSEVSPPETFPDMGIKIVAFDNFEYDSFTLDSDAIVYILVQNPEQHQFDAWLMTETELDDYRSAIASLPASAEDTHQNYKAEYGVDLSDSMSSGVPTNIDLSAGEYHILMDNTDLGGNDTFLTEEISYQYAVYAGSELVLITED